MMDHGERERWSKGIRRRRGILKMYEALSSYSSSSSPQGVDRVFQATNLSMEERKWEDLSMDCLANIFGRVEIESLLLDVPFVCKSWYKATLSPLCWQRLVFPKPSPYPRCYGSFNSRLLKKYQLHGVLSNPSFMMKSAINRSRRSATMIALPSSCTEETLLYVAEECPDLRNLELPYHLGGDLMRKIPNLISKWKNLEHLRLDCSFEIPIIAKISRHCKKFHSLTVIGADIGRDKASAIVSLLPNIRYLDISYANIEKENLLKVLEGCKELVYFDVSKCITFKVDDEILKLGSRISRFKYG